MVWIHTGRPMTEVSDLILHWPSIFVSVLLRCCYLMKDFHWCPVTTKPCRSIFSFLTIIWMRKDTSSLEYKEPFLTNSLKGIFILGWNRLTNWLDLERPVQEYSIILQHLCSHFCDSSSRWSFYRSYCFGLLVFWFKHYRGHTSFKKRRLSIKVNLKEECPCSL